MSRKKGKMRSKTKIGVRKPPLSVIDGMIYLVGFALSVGIGLAMLSMYDWLYDKLVFGDPSVVAVTHGTAMTFALFMMVGWLFGSLRFLWRHFSAKQPIFGNPNITYGVFPWKKDLFPVFGFYPEKGKLKRDTYQIRKKRKEKILMASLCVGMALLLLAYGGLRGACLRDDLTVTMFDAFGESLKHVYTREEFEALELSVHYHTGSKHSSGYWDLSAKIQMQDGKARRFCYGGFRDHEVIPDTMRALKASLPDHAVTMEGTDKLDHIIEKYEYDAAQARMLRELFEVEK